MTRHERLDGRFLQQIRRCAILVTIFLAPSLRGEPTRQPIRPLNGPSIRMPQGADQLKLPLTRSDDALFIQVSVNGAEPKWYLLDTGSPATTIDPGLAKQLKLKEILKHEIHLFGGSKQSQVVEANDIRVGGVSTGPRYLSTLDLSELREAGVDVWGILGMDLLLEAPWTIDFREPSLTFHVPGKIPEALKKRAAHLTLEPWLRLAVPASVDGQRGQFAIDTGMSDRFGDVAMSLAESIPGRRVHQHSVEDVMREIGGSYRLRRAQFEKLTFAGREFDRTWFNIVDAAVAEAGKSPSERSCVGTLGIRVFEDARLTVDCDAHEAWLEWLAPETLEGYLRRLDAQAIQKGKVAGLPPLIRALRDRRMDAVKALVARKGGVNVKVASWSAISAAAHWPEALQLLLAHGADPNLMSNMARPALCEAAEEGDLESVRLLIRSGAKVNQVASDGTTALIRAASVNYPNIVEELLKEGADVNYSMKEGTTALGMAAHRGAKESVSVLLKHGARVDAATEDGYTPLFAAANRGATEIVRMLLDAGAKVKARAKDGGTPLLAAVSNDDEALVRMLLDAGADPALKLKDGRTAADIAIDNGEMHSLQALLKLAPEKVVLPRGATSVSIPLARYRGTVCAHVTIDGQDAGWFCLTARAGMVIDSAVAARLKLPMAASSSEALKRLARRDVTICRANEVRIGNVSTGPRVMLTQDFSGMPFTNGQTTGMLDYKLLFDLPCAIDFQKPELTFYANSAALREVTRDATPLEADFESGLSIRAELQGESGWFWLFPGYSSRRFEIAGDFVAQRQKSMAGMHPLSDVRLTDDRVLDCMQTNLEWAKIAGHRLENVRVSLSLPESSSKRWTWTLAGEINGISGTGRLVLDARSDHAWYEWRKPEPLQPYLHRIQAKAAPNSGPGPEPELSQALADDREDAAELLIASGADVNRRNVSGYTPLMLADRPAMVKRLLGKGADPNAKASFMGTTPLIFAVERGNLESVKLLLAGGAKVDEPNFQGNTALIRAAEGNWPEIVEVLLANGADINAANKDGATPLMLANGEARPLLLKHHAKVNLQPGKRACALILAAYRGDVDAMRALIDAGADVNQTSNGVTPLIVAAMENRVAAMRLLLSHGATTSAAPGQKSAYDWALEKRSLDAMRVLRYELPARQPPN